MPQVDQEKRARLAIKLNHVLLAEGISKPTMSSLAKSIGISRASLYLAFKNKEDIVRAVVDRHLQFVQLNPVPTTFEADQFPKILLDTLLLSGSTTDIFTNELHTLFPELWAQLDAAYQQHFVQWKQYASKAKRAHYLCADLSADFLLFHARSSVRSILADVAKGGLTLPNAEKYLRQTVTVLLRGITTVPEAALNQLAANEPYQRRILVEFRETYGRY